MKPDRVLWTTREQQEMLQLAGEETTIKRRRASVLLSEMVESKSYPSGNHQCKLWILEMCRLEKRWALHRVTRKT